MTRGGSGKTRSVRTAPYTSYRTFMTFIEDLREHGVPSRIDRSVLTRFSGAVGGQLMHALRFLGLIDDEGRTTQRLGELAVAHGGAEWPEALSQLLMEAYAPVFAIDLETATPSHFNAAFRNAFPAADAVIQKCVTFFLYAAADAGLKVSARILGGPKAASARAAQDAKADSREGEGGRGGPVRTSAGCAAHRAQEAFRNAFRAARPKRDERGTTGGGLDLAEIFQGKGIVIACGRSAHSSAARN